MRLNVKTQKKEKTMYRKIIITIFISLFCSAFAHADALDESLPAETPEMIKTRTRQMISEGTPTDAAINFTRAMFQHRFRAEEILKAQDIIIEAKQQGLPVEPIMNKAYEGVIKQAKDVQIVSAMEKVRNRYSIAHQLSNEIAQEHKKKVQIRNTIAASLSAGLHEKDIDKIMNAFKARIQNQSRRQYADLALESFKASRDMARLGVNSQAITDVVCQAIEKNYQANEMQQLRQTFRQRSRNEDPQGLAHRFAWAFAHGQKIEDLDESDQEDNSGKSGSSHQNGGSNKGGNSNGNNGSGSSDDSENSNGNQGGSSGSGGSNGGGSDNSGSSNGSGGSEGSGGKGESGGSGSGDSDGGGGSGGSGGKGGNKK